MSADRHQHVLLYDDECPLCAFQMRALTWMDWLNKVSVCPISHERVRSIAPQLTREQLLEAIHCVSPDGTIYRGARAIRFLGMRLPLLLPIGVFLWIPGVIWIAEWVYMLISRNRHVLSRWFGCKEACSLLPHRKRSTDIAVTEQFKK